MAARDDVVTELIATRGRALVGYAYLLCGNVSDAEDLVQDALVRTFSRRRSGLRFDSAEGYVRTAILHGYLDGRRRRSRWAARRHLLVEPSAIDGPEGATGDRIDVVAALQGLPRQQRAAVVLRFYEDLTVAEIAERLGVSTGAVKRYLHLGIAKLEQHLGPVADANTDITLVQEG